MTQSYRRLSFLGDANPDDIVVHIARAGGAPKAGVMMPVVAGIERSLEYLSLEQASTLARSAAEEHGMALAVIVDSKSGLTWQHEWDRWFDTVPDP